MKRCSCCKLAKEDSEFSPSHLKKKYGRCRECRKRETQDEERKRLVDKKWREEHEEEIRAYGDLNKDKINVQRRKRRQANKEKTRAAEKKWRDANPDKVRASAKKSQMKPENRERRNRRTKERRQNDPPFRLRANISSNIKFYLTKNGGSKRNGSILDHLPYTIEELRAHLEGLFEPWMNWSNYGEYEVATWNDNDPSTWKWQLDHIIPQSDLPYSSMEDENFKRCWALENLRPYSAKQNNIDGTSRARHTEKTTINDIENKEPKKTG